jgi:dihydroxyacetone kinase
MTGPALAAWLCSALQALIGARDELADLDSAAGDGDLGATVAGGAQGVIGALEALPGTVLPGTVLRTAGAAFARANPASFSALVGAGALAGARVLGDAEEVESAAVLAAGRTAAEVIAERGRSALGDRTVLDALVPSLDALATVGPVSRAQQLAAMIAAARAGVEKTATMTPRRGRAAWVGQRSLGFADAGATAYLRLLEALAEACLPQ